VPFWVLANVVGGEGTQRRDRSPRIAQVLQESVHETSGVSLSPVLGPCSDVRHDHQATSFGVLGHADDVAVSAKFEASISGVLDDDEQRHECRYTSDLGKFGHQCLVRRFGQVRSHGAETVVHKARAMLKDTIQ
jgi:hypothetical protein